jgi:polyhydroxybutyrate depolymerase
MMRLFAPLILALGIFATAPATAETREIIVEQDGLPRSFLLTVPEGLNGPAPLVLALHGLLETGESMQLRVARTRLDIFAEKYGFIVAYPSAWGRVWNLGEGTGAARLTPKRDDLAFLDRVIAETASRASIDRRRIFVAGFSMGGMMGFSFACKRPGLIRAISATASLIPAMLADDCAAHPPEGVLVIHGTEDDVVPFDGGPVISGPFAMMSLASYDETLRFFARRNGCRTPPERRDWDAKNDNTSVTRSGWYHCARGAVEGYRIEGGGHRWPSGGPILPVTGRTTREIDGTAAVWGFFSRFR